MSLVFALVRRSKRVGQLRLLFVVQVGRATQRRADSVLAYLVEQGVDEPRLNATGYGETQLKIDPEESDEDKAANRRIEFRVS